MRPRIPGKLTTLLLFVWFVVLLAPGAEQLVFPLFILTAASALIASADYLTGFGHALRERRRAATPT